MFEYASNSASNTVFQKTSVFQMFSSIEFTGSTQLSCLGEAKHTIFYLPLLPNHRKSKPFQPQNKISVQYLGARTTHTLIPVG